MQPKSSDGKGAPKSTHIIKRIEHTAHNLEADERIALDTRNNNDLRRKITNVRI